MNWNKIANFIQAATNLALFYAAIVVLALVLIASHGCARVDNNHNIHADGEATIRVVVGVDVTACEGMSPEDKAECVQTMLELAKILAEANQDEPTALGGI